MSERVGPIDVAGRRIVLTGGSRGLGTYLARAFVDAGARVALVARDEALLSLEADRLGGQTIFVAADISRPDANEEVVASVVAAWGGLDVWIGNAGISPIVAGPLDTDPRVWRQILEVNLNGAFYGARAASRVLGAGGRIIFTGSVLGERPRKGLAAYSASKAAIVALAKSLALDLAERDITVNVVNPGWFDSPLTEPWQQSDALTESVLGHTALRRWGAPHELAGAYLFLASQASSFVTGTTITVDGGYTCV